MNKSEQLIACLEGEIAKRDARIVELESAAESLRLSRDYHHEQEIEYRRRWAGIYAAPVSEAKAQGSMLQKIGKRLAELLDEDQFAEVEQMLASLNAAPVQQVSVPDGWKHGLPPDGEICEARIPHHTADGRQMIWCEVEVIAHSIINGAIYSWVKETGQDGSFYAPMMLSFRKLAAATAAPAADATVRQATDGGRNQSYEGLFDGETEEQRASRLAAHSAKGVV